MLLVDQKMGYVACLMRVARFSFGSLVMQPYASYAQFCSLTSLRHNAPFTTPENSGFTVLAKEMVHPVVIEGP